MRACDWILRAHYVINFQIVYLNTFYSLRLSALFIGKAQDQAAAAQNKEYDPLGPLPHGWGKKLFCTLLLVFSDVLCSVVYYKSLDVNCMLRITALFS